MGLLENLKAKTVNSVGIPDNPGAVAGIEGPVVARQLPSQLLGSTIARRSVIYTLWGATSSGKTYHAFTAPGPITWLQGAEKQGVGERFVARGKVIKEVNWGVDLTQGSADEKQRAAMATWLGFKNEWRLALQESRTIVLDTHTYLYEVLRYAYFGDPRPNEEVHNMAYGAAWGPVNAEWKALFNSVRSQDRCILICIGNADLDFNASKGAAIKTYYMAGQKRVPEMSDVIVKCMRGTGGEFITKCEKAWHRDEEPQWATFKPAGFGFPEWMGLISPVEGEPGVWGP